MSQNEKSQIKNNETKELGIVTKQSTEKTIEQLQDEIQELRLKLGKIKHAPFGRIGTLFFALGFVSLFLSIYFNSQILAFIGLGLTFWGALFFFIKPTRYVESTLLPSIATSYYFTIDRIVKDLGYHGKSYYIPPYPKEIYIPEHLKGLKDMIVCISADEEYVKPSIEDLAQSKFFTNPNGICLPPPGVGLLTQFENILGKDVTKIEPSELHEKLKKIILEELQLAKDIEIVSEESIIYLKIFDSVFKDLYRQKLDSVHLLGSPIASAIACATSKNTGKRITLDRDLVSSDSQIIEVWYRIVGD